jgi:hypothetical protein
MLVAKLVQFGFPSAAPILWVNNKGRHVMRKGNLTMYLALLIRANHIYTKDCQ